MKGPRSWVEPAAPHRHDPSSAATAGADAPPESFKEFLATMGATERLPRQRYVYAATTAQEIGWLRKRSGHGGPAAQRVAHRGGESHARRYEDITRTYKSSIASPCVLRTMAQGLAWHP